MQVPEAYQAVLNTVINDLTVHHEVSATIEGMLGDLEVWEWANRVSELERDVVHWRGYAEGLKLQESRLIRERDEAKESMATDKKVAIELRCLLTKELWGLAKELSSSTGVKQGLEEARAKLRLQEDTEAALAEARAELAQLHAAQGVLQRGEPEDSGSEDVGGDEAAAEASLAADDAITPKELTDDEEQAEEEGRVKLGLHQLGDHAEKWLYPYPEPEPALFHVFSFLDPPSMLSIASAGKPMYGKVKAWSGASEELPVAQEIQPGQQKQQQQEEQKLSQAGETTAAGVFTRTRLASIGSFVASTPIGIAFQKAQAQGDFAGMAVAAGVPFLEKGTDSGGESSDTHAKQTLVEALSKKLTAQEMKSIGGMTQRLRQLEEGALTMQACKEDMAMKIQGLVETNAVLRAKVQEGQAELKKELDAKGLADRQTAMDQEVINFLDARTQETERVAQESMQKAVKLQDIMAHERAEAARKIKMLEDMMRFEKEKAEEAEGQWRQQKKLLVGEVKKLRAINMAIQQEKDDSLKKLKELRDSVKDKHSG
ncbi:unnamed protein product [Chrysoparadoxa australica]